MPDPTVQRYFHKTFDPAPWPISEPNHCITVFEKLRLQREQGRFCDVILKVSGRDFPAHRCVLASCSSRFDKMFKVHKTMKEIIEVENCKNYEVFHLVLTYMYTGKISLDKHNLADILEIAHIYTITKLKSYCSEFLEKYYLRPKDCLRAVELSVRYSLTDLKKQTLEYIHKHFKQIFKFHDFERMSLTKLQEYLNHSYWIPHELILRVILRWIGLDQGRREEHFVQLFDNVNEQTLGPLNSLEKEEKEMYQLLHEKYIPDYQEIEQELEDQSSFLSIAFSAVKDLENQEVDESFSSYILQQENMTEAQQYGNYRQQQSEYKQPLDQNLISPPSLIPEPSYAPETSPSLASTTNSPTKHLVKNEHVAENSKSLPIESNQTIRMEEEGDSSYPSLSGDHPQPHTMLYPAQSTKMMITTPDNSAASSPIPSSSVPSPINHSIIKYREHGDQQYWSQSDRAPHHMSDIYHGHAGQLQYRDAEYGHPPADMYRYQSSGTGVQCVPNYDPYRLPDNDVMMHRHQDFAHFREINMMPPEEKTYNPQDNQRLSLDFKFEEYPIIEQFINEEEERTKYSATKRYDPKHRALAQAFRRKDMSQEGDGHYYNSVQSGHDSEQCSSNNSNSIIRHFGSPPAPAESLSKLEPPSDCHFHRGTEGQESVRDPRNNIDTNVEAPLQESSNTDTFQQQDEYDDCNQGQNLTIDESRAPSSAPTPEPRNEAPVIMSANHQDPLRTPEKSDFIQLTPSSEQKRRPEHQQLFLTPKEKYAKELSSQNYYVPHPVHFVEIKNDEVNDQQSLEACPESSLSKQAKGYNENRVVYPTGSKILKSKKKMASKNRLILEHGEVRLSQRQRLRIRLKKPRKLRPRDIFQPTETTSTSENVENESSEGAPKKIINRKDKLLAEHRAEHQILVLSEEEKRNIFKCEVCSFKCATKRKLKLHGKVHSDNKKFVCPFCTEVSYWIKDHHQHIQANHISGKPPYKCPRCDYQNARLQQVITHQTSHSVAMPFKCQIEDCTFKTKSLVNLKNHEKNHGGQKFICPICEKAFSHKATLEQHKAVHSDEKKFKCKLCTYSTKYNSHLAAHRRVHEGKVHRCTFDGCQYWTPKGTLLKAHIRAHNGDKIFKCNTCLKGFVEAGQLRRHEKIHSEAKPFACNECTYVTNRKDKLKEHQGRSHKPKENLEEAENKLKKRPSKIIFNTHQPNPDSPDPPEPAEMVTLNFSQL